MSAILIYATYKDVAQARDISKALVEARLVACANILPAHESLYWWDGAVQNAFEVAVIYKTRAENFAAVEAKIKELHSYDCPCIVALPIGQGYKPFLDWIMDNSKESVV